MNKQVKPSKMVLAEGARGCRLHVSAVHEASYHHPAQVVRGMVQLRSEILQLLCPIGLVYDASVEAMDVWSQIVGI